MTSQYQKLFSVKTCAKNFQVSLYILIFDTSNRVRFYSDQTHRHTHRQTKRIISIEDKRKLTTRPQYVTS